ncbi:hypothetical protein ACQEWB_14280 [Streptomyces sp. CA-249302]|uniref:hypothetical protein n=1 Tax=Streptomyces sp. CA-249302 TaxID=3240058 RepID=UPI003D8BA595
MASAVHPPPARGLLVRGCPQKGSRDERHLRTGASEPEPIDVISVIQVTDFRNSNGDFEHRIPPVSATEKAEDVNGAASAAHACSRRR